MVRVIAVIDGGRIRNLGVNRIVAISFSMSFSSPPLLPSSPFPLSQLQEQHSSNRVVTQTCLIIYVNLIMVLWTWEIEVHSLHSVLLLSIVGYCPGGVITGAILILPS